jgi:universal stress protein E
MNSFGVKTLETENFLVVYDPTRKEQLALERAGGIASERGANIHLFACIHGELDPALNKSSEIARLIAEQTEELYAAASGLIEQGVSVTAEVEWEKDWYQSVVRVSQRVQPRAVFKFSFSHSTAERVMGKTSDWTLIRECDCPVMLVKAGDRKDVRRILAAVDLAAPKVSYQKLNQAIIELGKEVSDNRDAEVHYVNAVRDLKMTPDSDELLNSTGVPRENIHVRIGDPEKVIVQQAKALDVSLVVVGHSSRTGFAAAVAGNTAEKILDQLECDVLSIPQYE